MKTYFLARIENTQQETPSVRLVHLKILPQPTISMFGLPDFSCADPCLFDFKSGQWIDTYLPHLPKPGGFSFVSTAKKFRETGIVSLAIQLTDNPASKWLWQEDIAGKYMMSRVGGNFTFPPTGFAPLLNDVKYVQFIAGGIGIKYFIAHDGKS
jgi:hypothetical protein